MPAVTTKLRQPLLLLACFLGLSLLTTACGSSDDSCGDGYHLGEGGTCVPDAE